MTSCKTSDASYSPALPPFLKAFAISLPYLHDLVRPRLAEWFHLLEVAPIHLKDRETDLIAPEPHDLIAVIPDVDDVVVPLDVCLVDLPLDYGILARVSAHAHVEIRVGDMVIGE